MTDLEKALADPRLTREKLFSLYAAAIRDAWKGSEVTFSAPDTLCIVSPEGKEQTAYLENLWRMCHNEAPEDRFPVFQRHLRGLLQAFDTPAPSITKKNIVPLIKDSEYLTASPELLKEHLAGDLWVVYALDLPDSYTTLSSAQRDKLGITQAELRGIAVANLVHILPEIQQHGSGPWYMLTAGQDYVASILLLDEVWQQLGEQIEGEIVATVPARDVLLYTSNKSKEGLTEIRQKSREVTESGHHVISHTLLRRTSGQWKVFE